MVAYRALVRSERINLVRSKVKLNGAGRCTPTPVKVKGVELFQITLNVVAAKALLRVKKVVTEEVVAMPTALPIEGMSILRMPCHKMSHFLFHMKYRIILSTKDDWTQNRASIPKENSLTSPQVSI